MDTTILLTHTPKMRRDYYGERALAGLAALGRVRLHEGDMPLDATTLMAAAKGCQIIVSDRQTPGEAAIFGALPDLVAFVRCAVDIRNVAVAEASRHGVLVTQASAGFVPAVTELVLGYLVDLARGITPAATTYRTGVAPIAVGGRQLESSALGIIGYGAIGQRLADLGLALGMTVLISDPFAMATKPGIAQVDLPVLLAQSDFVVCLAIANEQTENLMNEAAFARMKSSAYFINVSRGGLVDEEALEQALAEHRIAGAALDVGRAPDQMPSLHLARRTDVIATPHIGGLTPQAIEHQALETVAQTAEIVKGKAPVGSVNTDRATRLARLR
jgi:D-3-phosphoglycerate dehydrogenase